LKHAIPQPLRVDPQCLNKQNLAQEIETGVAGEVGFEDFELEQTESRSRD